MATTEQFSLRWNNFHSNITSGFHELLQAAEMVDVTLAVEGQFLQAHKVVLSICSPYFRELFKVNPCKHPIVILKDVGHDNMKDILEFMYLGEVNVLRENLSNFLRTAEFLQVKGLSGDDSSDTSSRKDDKLDSLNDNEDDTDLLQYNQLIDSDMELPQQYSTPHIPTPPPSSPVTTTTTTTATTTAPMKRQKNSHNSSLKRTKSENGSQNHKTVVKTEQDTVYSKTTQAAMADESEFVESSFQLDRPGVDMEDTKDNLRQTLENSGTTPGSTESNQVDQGRADVKFNRILYQCDKCFKKFTRRDHLRTHEKNIHGEDAGPFVCVICTQLYKNTESLRKHIAKFHYPKIVEFNPKVEVNA